MSIDVLLGRNRAFAHSGGHHDVPLVPRQQLFVITCLDPRTDPAAFLGLQGGDAMVIRNAGGRVTPRVVDDVAFISYLAETMVGADGPLFEVAIVHHTECGTGFPPTRGSAAALPGAPAWTSGRSPLRPCSTPPRPSAATSSSCSPATGCLRG